MDNLNQSPRNERPKHPGTSRDDNTKSSQKWIFFRCLCAVIVLTFFRLSVTFHRQSIETSSLSALMSERPVVENEKIIEHEPLNIVLFYADDWTMQVLGKLNPLVQTPNIDKMADNGMLFTENFVTTSVCWISRASLMVCIRYRLLFEFAVEYCIYI